MKTRQRAIAALLIPAALLLASCKSINTMEITDDGGAIFTMDIVFDPGQMAQAGMSCADLESEMASTDPLDGGSVEVTEITDGCRVVSSLGYAVDGSTLIDNGDSYTVVLEGDDTGVSPDDLSQMGAFEFSFAIVMPGEIVDYTPGGTVSGTTVTYTDINVLSSGIEVTGLHSGGKVEVEPTTEAPTPTDEKPTPADEATTSDDKPVTSDDDSSSGTPIWVWILIGVGALVVIGGVVFLVTRKKGGSDDNPQYPQNGPYGQGPQSPYGQNQGGQPNQYGQAPQTGQYPAAQGQYPAYGQPNQYGQAPTPPTAAYPQQFQAPVYQQPTQQFPAQYQDPQAPTAPLPPAPEAPEAPGEQQNPA